MSYGDLIWEHLLERLEHLTWRCKGCAHISICEEQPDGTEPLYCEAILEAAVRGYEEWKTSRRAATPPQKLEEGWPSYEEACDGAGVRLCLDGSQKLYDHLTDKMLNRAVVRGAPTLDTVL